MIQIQPIEIKFVGTATQVKPIIKNYELLGTADAIISLEFYNSDGKFLCKVQQPVSSDVYGEYKSFFDAFQKKVAEWGLTQNNIVQV